MFHLYFAALAAAQAIAVAQHQQRENENARRRALGLPPLPPVQAPLISEKEQRENRREEIKDDIAFWSFVVFGGLIFTAPFAALIYAVIKIAFAKEGIDWP